MKPQEQTYSKSRRLKNQIKAVVTNPYNIIVLIAVVLLVYLIVLPLLDMIATTSTLPYLAFRYQNGNSPQASDCVAIVMFSIVFLVYAIANLSGKADLAKSMAG